VVKHPAKVKSLRAQWDQNCASIFKHTNLSRDQKIKVIMDWLAKAGVWDFVLGQLVLQWAKPSPTPLTDEQKKERLQKSLVKNVYKDDIPHLRAVTRVVSDRLGETPTDALGTFASIDEALDENDDPAAMFAEFSRRIDEQVSLEYRAAQDEVSDAAE
jgi:hypothetical protein